MSPQPIRGLVARILDESTIVLNVGRVHGVESGMGFVVYIEEEDVPDPSTGESLGRLELVKAFVEAVHVQEKMTLASPPQDDDTAHEKPQVLSAVLAQTDSAAQRSRTRLSVRRTDISGVRSAGPITVGDMVRSV